MSTRVLVVGTNDVLLLDDVVDHSAIVRAVRDMATMRSERPRVVVPAVEELPLRNLVSELDLIALRTTESRDPRCICPTGGAAYHCRVHGRRKRPERRR